MTRKKTSLTDSLVIVCVVIAVFGIGIFLAVDGMQTVPVQKPELPLTVVKQDTVKPPTIKFNADSLKDSVKIMKDVKQQKDDKPTERK
jgi:hypothetical protein